MAYLAGCPAVGLLGSAGLARCCPFGRSRRSRRRPVVMCVLEVFLVFLPLLAMLLACPALLLLSWGAHCCGYRCCRSQRAWHRPGGVLAGGLLGVFAVAGSVAESVGPYSIISDSSDRFVALRGHHCHRARRSRHRLIVPFSFLSVQPGHTLSALCASYPSNREDPNVQSN